MMPLLYGVPEPQTVEQVFEWANRIIRQQRPAIDDLHAIRNAAERAAVWEGAAKRLARIAAEEDSSK